MRSKGSLLLRILVRLYLPKTTLRSNVENTLAPAKESSASRTKGTGKLSTLMTLLILRKSTQNLYDPPFYQNNWRAPIRDRLFHKRDRSFRGQSNIRVGLVTSRNETSSFQAASI